jgi:hypothetical protein
MYIHANIPTVGLVFVSSLASFKRGLATALPEFSVGIQKRFAGVEIPRFEVPYQFSVLTTSLFSRGGILNLVFNRLKLLRFI